MRIEAGGIEITIEELARNYAEIFDTTKAAMVMDDSPGGYLVPPEYTVEIAVRLGMAPLPEMRPWCDFVHAEIGNRPRWWKWLFHNYSTNKIASFLVWRWPKFPAVVAAYSEVCEAMHQQQEERVKQACEYLRSRLGRPMTIPSDDYTLRFPVEERSVSAVGRTVIVDDALVIDAAWTETSEPFVMKAKIENRDDWRYCTMEPASDDEADLD